MKNNLIIDYKISILYNSLIIIFKDSYKEEFPPYQLTFNFHNNMTKQEEPEEETTEQPEEESEEDASEE